MLGTEPNEEQYLVENSRDDTERATMTYMQKNNYLSNQFLFGEDIEVDQMELNKMLRKN